MGLSLSLSHPRVVVVLVVEIVVVCCLHYIHLIRFRFESDEPCQHCRDAGDLFLLMHRSIVRSV